MAASSLASSLDSTYATITGFGSAPGAPGVSETTATEASVPSQGRMSWWKLAPLALVEFREVSNCETTLLQPGNFAPSACSLPQASEPGSMLASPKNRTPCGVAAAPLPSVPAAPALPPPPLLPPHAVASSPTASSSVTSLNGSVRMILVMAAFRRRPYDRGSLSQDKPAAPQRHPRCGRVQRRVGLGRIE